MENCVAVFRITGKSSDISYIRENLINDNAFHIESISCSVDKRLPIKIDNVTDIASNSTGLDYFDVHGRMQWSVKDTLIDNNSGTGFNLTDLTELYDVVVEYYAKEYNKYFHEHGVVVSGFLEEYDLKPFYRLPMCFSPEVLKEVNFIYINEDSTNYTDCEAFRRWVTACNVYNNSDDYIDNVLYECNLTRDDLYILYINRADAEYIDIGGFDVWEFKDLL